MLAKRIIPCLDIKDGRTVKGTSFVNLKDAGDPIELAKKYSREGADELVFLDISATQEKRKTLSELVYKIAKEINIPFTVGGGINTLEDADVLISSGADKVSINSAAVRNPELITDIASKYGTQCVVVAIDGKQNEYEVDVYVSGGNKTTEWTLFDWANKAQELGAGEILYTSMDKDGQKSGFDDKNLKVLSENLNIPIIASGGGGNADHFISTFRAGSDAALAASIFHYQEVEIQQLKQTLKENGIPVRL